MTFEELSEKKKKMEDECASYKEAVRTFLEQCVKDAGLSNTKVRLKRNPEIVGRLYIEYYYSRIEIVSARLLRRVLFPATLLIYLVFLSASGLTSTPNSLRNSSNSLSL